MTRAFVILGVLLFWLPVGLLVTYLVAYLFIVPPIIEHAVERAIEAGELPLAHPWPRDLDAPVVKVEIRADEVVRAEHVQGLGNFTPHTWGHCVTLYLSDGGSAELHYWPFRDEPFDKVVRVAGRPALPSTASPQ